MADATLTGAGAAGPARPSRAAGVVARAEAALAASASVPLLAQMADGTVGGDAFARYLAVEHDFVRTAARLAGYLLWQQPDWSLALRHAAAVADLVGPQDAYFARLVGEHPVDGRELPDLLDRASGLRHAVEAALAEGGPAGVVTSLAAAETLYLRWCGDAVARDVARPAAVQEWIELHATEGFRAQVASLHDAVDRLPAEVGDADLDRWFVAMLAAEDAFHAAPLPEGHVGPGHAARATAPGGAR